MRRILYEFDWKFRCQMDSHDNNKNPYYTYIRNEQLDMYVSFAGKLWYKIYYFFHFVWLWPGHTLFSHMYIWKFLSIVEWVNMYTCGHTRIFLYNCCCCCSDLKQFVDNVQQGTCIMYIQIEQLVGFKSVWPIHL